MVRSEQQMHLAIWSVGTSKRICVQGRGETRESEAEFETWKATISIGAAEVRGRLGDRFWFVRCEEERDREMEMEMEREKGEEW